MIPKLKFCEDFVRLRREPMRFDGRPYLPAIYDAAGNVVLRCSRQSEKSTFVCNTLIYQSVLYPNTSCLLVCPRIEQARVFFRDRLQPAIEESPYLRRILLKGGVRMQFGHTRFANGSSLFLRGAFHSADTVRGISCDLLVVDEFQDAAPGNLPVLQETLSHSPCGRTILAGTPKTCDNHLEHIFRQSTANEWKIACTGCERDVILDESSLGAKGLACPHCQAPLNVATGRWIPRNPHSTWGAGFWVNHLMTPWINHHEVLQRQRDYDLARFKNEVLGLSTALGDHVVSRAELEACCTERSMARCWEDLPACAQGQVVLGIDWGGGGSSRTVVVVGYMRPEFAFEICRFVGFRANEEPKQIVADIARLCRDFRIGHIAADGGGNGSVYNRLLLDRLDYQPHCLHAMFYANSEQQPWQDGNLWKWTIHRSGTIGTLFSRVKKQSLLFPHVEESGCYLDEFSCEIAEFDDHERTVRYTHPAQQTDDALHAANYGLVLATKLYHRQAAGADW